MNDRREENALKIADYLENRLSSAEEESFVRELGEDEALRRQYEEELLIRAMLGRGEGAGEGLVGGEQGGEGLWQPADEHLRMVTEILEKDREARKPGAKIALFGRGGMVAAALLVIISGTVLYIRISHKGAQHGPVAVVPAAAGHGAPEAGGGETGMRVAAGSDAGKRDSAVRQAAVAGSAFASCYTPYSGVDDPVEVSLYYRDYKKGNYAAVLAARGSDYQVMGAGTRGDVIRGYMQFYKGLSYLATGRAAEAIVQFDSAAGHARPGEVLRDAVEWYEALAWLKRTDVDPRVAVEKARVIARAITHTSSLYKLRAERLIQALGS